MNITSDKAIQERLRKERQAWRALRKIFEIMALRNKTNLLILLLLLRNSIARDAVKYGIQTLEIAGREKRCIGGFAFITYAEFKPSTDPKNHSG